jgi:type I restriction enzyme S subunit
MMVLRIRPAQHSAYIMWQLNCPHVYQQASEHIIGATSPHVNVEQIRNYLLVLPPKSEQQRIVDHIDAELGAIAPVLLRAEKEVVLAGEYRTRLVADVVTGQLDVRAAAASLPDIEPELAPTEPSDDDDADIDDSEAA